MKKMIECILIIGAVVAALWFLKPEYFRFHTRKTEAQSEFVFAKYGSNSYYLYDYDGVDEYVEVPSKYKRLDVVAIGKNAFTENEYVRSIALPTTIERIEPEAFKNCKNLENVYGCDGIKIIEDEAFASCTKLKSVEIENKLYFIGNKAFYDCTNLNLSFIKRYKGYVGDYAIDAKSLDGVYFDNISYNETPFYNLAPKYVRIADKNDLSLVGKNNLTNLYLTEADQLYEVGDCPNLETISLPSGIESFDISLFPSLKHVDFEGTEEEWNEIYDDIYYARLSADTTVKLYYRNVDLVVECMANE